MPHSWEHEQNIKDCHAFEKEGYTFEVTSNGYFVRLYGSGLGGAGVKLPRDKPQHWRHARADREEYLKQAVMFARRHKANRKTLVVK